MHSSRMRTARSLTASSGRGGVCGREGHAWQGGACMGGVRGGGCACMAGGVHGGGCAWWGGGACPPVNRMTDACKKITLPQTSFAGGKNLRIRNKLPHFNSQHARRLCSIPLSFTQCLWK